MGAADVVPGVSGGTIAFISGIYEELITSINNINLSLIKNWKNEGFNGFWKKLNGNFLVALFLGIFISLFSLATLVSWLLENEPVLLWSFFFGLVAASIFFVGKEITRWNMGTVIILIFGAAIAYFITTLPASENATSLPLPFYVRGFSCLRNDFARHLGCIYLGLVRIVQNHIGCGSRKKHSSCFDRGHWRNFWPIEFCQTPKMDVQSL